MIQIQFVIGQIIFISKNKYVYIGHGICISMFYPKTIDHLFKIKMNRPFAFHELVSKPHFCRKKTQIHLFIILS